MIRTNQVVMRRPGISHGNIFNLIHILVIHQAEWFAEGLLERLLAKSDGLTLDLLKVLTSPLLPRVRTRIARVGRPFQADPSCFSRSYFSRCELQPIALLCGE